MSSIVAPSPDAPSFLTRVGAVLVAVVKHVVTRGVVWGALGLVIGIGCVGGSMVITLFTFDRGAALMGYLAPAFLIVPFVGMVLFAMHGLLRGAARAALDLEARFGLVHYVVERVVQILEALLGGPLSKLPLGQLHGHLKSAVEKYAGSGDMREGRGLSGWVVRRAKHAVASRFEPYFLSAYHAEAGPDGGVSLEKVGARVATDISAKLSSIVMSPLNTQLAVLMTVYVLAGLFWFHLVMGLVGLIGRVAG